MDLGTKSTARRQEIRKNRPDAQPRDWQQLRERGIPQSITIAVAFFLLATAIMLLRQNVVPYRPGQPVTHDIVSRVKFSYYDESKFRLAQTEASTREPRVYKADDEAWQSLEKDLLSLPIRMSAATEPPDELAKIFDDAGSRTALRQFGAPDAARTYEDTVKAFLQGLIEYRNKSASNHPLVLIPADEYREERTRGRIRIGTDTPIPLSHVYAVDDRAQLVPILQGLAEKAFPLALQGKMVEYSFGRLKPTHLVDTQATAYRKNEASSAILRSAGNRNVVPTEVLVSRLKGALDDGDVSLLRAEHGAYLDSLKGSAWKQYLGVAACTLIITLVMAAYIAAFQPRAVKNYARGGAIAGLMLAMLLLATLAGIGNGPIYLFGTGPTLLVAMILAIAYDRRFAMGIASLHGLLVTIALDQPASFFLVLWVGVLIAGFLLDDVRTRSKLVEVGGAAAIAMMFATGASGMLDMESGRFVLRNCLYTGAAGIAAGFIVLGILPFIEKIFRITTSMTLLELGDPSQPLFRRLQVEAPGTYNHSLQVANLAEAAAKAIGADSLLCRVAAYYHDVGKINKPDYFVENQIGGQQNRHLNLDPNLSLLIIVGHVKDGIELAREYNLPTSIIPFIQQHHGTTVVEYFYRRACSQQEQRDPTTSISEHHYRYEGPRPRTKEVGIMMLADCVESATRALGDPSPAQIEGLVRDLTMRRLLDRQFDECELTMKELELIQRSLIKTLAGMYHGRIPYPSQQQTAPETMQTTIGQIRPTGTA
ncbi:HD family phosphohydrolase [Humisphaera borealis]|uniref:HDIG domain-containing protein n=1 Tax=Humisphaera borealis TaxID=2807512 RepID=A0A7M2WZ55_9BACT|nr:HDIG domain-containing metalloprotein [Humisphaera borealis]QOV90719.1 HDIG domain-containing protein [Humisphaera borealis]